MDKIKDLRLKIDQLDMQVIALLKKRFEISDLIGKIKTKEKLPLIDKERKKQLITSKIEFTRKMGISENFIKKLFSLIHDYSVEIQKKPN
jgi:chorismate mutase